MQRTLQETGSSRHRSPELRSRRGGGGDVMAGFAGPLCAERASRLTQRCAAGLVRRSGGPSADGGHVTARGSDPASRVTGRLAGAGSRSARGPRVELPLHTLRFGLAVKC